MGLCIVRPRCEGYTSVGRRGATSRRFVLEEDTKLLVLFRDGDLEGRSELPQRVDQRSRKVPKGLHDLLDNIRNRLDCVGVNFYFVHRGCVLSTRLNNSIGREASQLGKTEARIAFLVVILGVLWRVVEVGNVHQRNMESVQVDFARRARVSQLFVYRNGALKVLWVILC